VSQELALLLAAAASIGVVHTVLGPDHYVPFIAMGRARNWSLRKTLGIAAACGAGHVISALGLGALAFALGWATGGVERLEAVRGRLAGWLLLGFGLAYAAWGIRHALRNRPHRHWHAHHDGTVHSHQHGHHGAHAHVHDVKGRSLTPWVLFVIFVLGPCEPLVPLLLVPAATGDPTGVALVALTFGLCTLTTLLALVAVGRLGLSRLPFGPLERYSHAVAGAALAACGLAIQLGL
jgi:sulfite exporter TauE/SafE